MKRYRFNLVTRVIIISLIFVIFLGLSFFLVFQILQRQLPVVTPTATNSATPTNDSPNQLVFVDGQQMQSESFNLNVNDDDLPAAMLLPLKTLGDFASTSATLATLVTSQGEIVLQLFPDQAPLTVANFVALSESGFYDGLKIHRLEPGFVVQTGDPTSRYASTEADLAQVGAGYPGYRLADEFSPLLSHDAIGVVSMANINVNGQYPNSSGSQFFITLAPATYLDGQYNIFARVTDGLDVLTDLKVGDEIIQITID